MKVIHTQPAVLLPEEFTEIVCDPLIAQKAVAVYLNSRDEAFIKSIIDSTSYEIFKK